MFRTLRLTGVALLALATVGVAQAGPASQDTLDRTLQSVLKALGREVPSDRLACLTGSAFAPAIDTRLACTSGWQVHSLRGEPNLEFVGKSLGLQVERVEATTVKAALSRGAKVLAEAGWLDEHRANSAGMITRVGEDGTLYGIPAEGEKEVVFANTDALWAIEPSYPSLKGWSGCQEMMRTAIDRIQGTGAYEANGHFYGLEAIDQIISRMETIPGYCGECKGEGWRCAATTLAAINDNAKIANRMLRLAVATAPQPCHRGVSRAAGFYRRMSLLLEPRISEEAMKATVGDLERQKEFVKKVLQPLRRDLEGVARYMEEAVKKG